MVLATEYFNQSMNANMLVNNRKTVIQGDLGESDSPRYSGAPKLSLTCPLPEHSGTIGLE